MNRPWGVTAVSVYLGFIGALVLTQTISSLSSGVMPASNGQILLLAIGNFVLPLSNVICSIWSLVPEKAQSNCRDLGDGNFRFWCAFSAGFHSVGLDCSNSQPRNFSACGPYLFTARGDAQWHSAGLAMKLSACVISL